MKLIWIALTTAMLGTSAVYAVQPAYADEKSEVDVNRLPAVVRDTIAREAQGGKLEKVHQVSDDGKLFRAEIKKEGKEHVLYVDADGKIVGRHMEK